MTKLYVNLCNSCFEVIPSSGEVGEEGVRPRDQEEGSGEMVISGRFGQIIQLGSYTYFVFVYKLT